MIKVPKKYWYIAKRLTTAQLQKDDYAQDYLNEADLFNINIGKRGHSFFLGYYSKEGLRIALEKYGITKIVNDKGFKDLIFEIDTNDPYIHRLTVFYQRQNPDHKLMEIVLKKETVNIDLPFSCKLNGRRYETIAIEWMALQNPLGSFTEERPRLPGQQYPGLGMASKIVELLIIAAWRLNLAGLLNTPERYHNAFLYSRIFYYINPLDQARFMAMARDMKKYPLHKVAWAMEWNAIQDLISGEPAKWFIAKQIIPLDKELKKLFNSADYKKIVNEKLKEYKFHLDEKTYLEFFEKKKENKLNEK